MHSIGAPRPFLFFRSLLLNPKAVGAVAPSSPKLARLMASRVGAESAPVLEIGAGTGVITEALLERGVDPERLIVVERDRQLAAFLRRRFPAVRVYRADALDCRRILMDYGVPRVRTVISSLPLRNLSPAERMQNVDAMLKSLAPEGQLIQYTYGAGCPIAARRFGLQAECLGRIWQNLPPAAVWRFVKRSGWSESTGHVVC